MTDERARIEADAALRESEERYRSLFAAHPHPMWFFDAETLAFLEVNDAAVAHYGYRRDEFLAMTIADIRPPEDVGLLRKAVGRVGEGAIDQAGVWRHRKKDGSIILVEITSHAAEYNGRRAEVVLAHDITARMNAETALRESEERFHAIFDLAPMGIAQADPATGRWVAVNPRMCLITGYSAGELVTMRVPEITHPEDRGRDWELFEKVVKGEAPEYRLEKRYLKKDGSIAWVNVNMVVLRDAAGRPTRTLALIEDITARKKAAEALVASESRYRVLFENAAEGIVAIDPETRRPLFHNPAVCAMFGYSSEEFGRVEVSDLHPKEALATIFAGITSAGRGERPGTEVVPCVRKDGSTFQADIRGSVVELEGRKVVFGFFTDVTQRVRATRRLSLQADMGRVLAEAASLAEAVPRILQALGENEGMAFGAWWEPDPDSRMLQCAHTWSADPARCAELAAATRSLVVEHGEGIPGTVWTTRRLLHLTDLAMGKGSPRAPVAARAGFNSAVGFPLLRQGEPAGVVEFFAPEISSLDPALAASVEMLGGQIALFLERRRAQEEAARYVAGSPAVIYALRVAGAGFRATWFSDNIFALTGYSHAEIEKDAQAWWGSGIHPDDSARVLEANRTVLEKDAASLEFRFRRKDGSWLWVRDEKRLLRDGAGRPTEIVGSWMDVTARVRLEEQLRQAQKMEAVGQLAGGVAHDFNNLLTVISGNSDLLLSGMPSDDPRRSALADIHAAGERAAALTRQLLAFSRKQILEPKLMDVHEVVGGIEKMLRRLLGEDVDLLTDLTADPSWVKVDPGQLEQVVINLAVNARDAMPRGGRITIRTWNVDPSDPVDLDETARRHLLPKVALSISDTGTGMPPEVKARLFEPFFTTKSVGKGTGLGLATVYGIVKQSEGDITVESEPGKGTTFTIVLPSQSAPQPLDGSGRLHRKAPRGTETVLIVEDEDAVRRIVKVALESAGYGVIEARSGLAALEAARTHSGRIHLVVTDVVMPEMSGREVAARIAEAHPGVRILYMSGYTDDAVVRHGIVEAGVAFLQKPFSPLALARKVREVLDAGP